MQVARLRTPIVLVHGLFGFDQVRLGDWVVADYFPGIAAALRGAGNRVLQARLSPTAGIADRAAQLKAFIDRESPADPVHLFGHSMGGLDARYMISRLDMAARVLSLTTLGTPHRGSPFADWAATRLIRMLGPVLEFLGLPRQAFLDLTTAACRTFNESTPDAPGVRYFSVAGRFRTRWVNPAWRFSAPIVAHAEGDNDGIVSVASATYGDHTDVWEADHLSLVNWAPPWSASAGPRDRRPDYARLVARLAEMGF
jgi:triacylglycerol lipase